ncbi:hypothetical protein ILUMI_04511 [Ignelater luminosus]|uniref:Putative alpha-L-fucosidase n=1 Tax=Ignelater luminosus TaxID=2038154 RepID=A0A8K0DEB6_IGNLU|nr:hypothetical protein ILUMI_04511 [Ignelater luminosus]
MIFSSGIFLILLIFDGAFSTPAISKSDGKYAPTWESLDKRPLPKWYDEAKIGIFLHWGVYSVPSFGSEWFWANWKNGGKPEKEFMRQNYPPGFTYQDFAKDFTAEFFTPTDWAAIFQKSGAKYVILTSKHHEGYALWPSKYSFSWNAKDVGPNRDLVGDLAAAVHSKNLKFGLYYSLFEWFNPLYQADAKANFKTNNFVVNKIIPEMVELVQNYTPEVIWSDGDWDANDTYWKATEFLAWLYNESPVKDTVIANDRWGVAIRCQHGDFYTCADRYNPKVLQNHKWENAMTLDKVSWGYRRYNYITDIMTTAELITTLTETISCGGNILINIGPTHDGRIDLIFQERLLDLGKWLSINGKAIYKSTPWKHQNDGITDYVWYTSKNATVFAISLEWPKNNTLKLESAVELFENKRPIVTMLGNLEKLKWSINKNRISKTVRIQFPNKATVACDWAWVIQIENPTLVHVVQNSVYN